jgi:TIR domain
MASLKEYFEIDFGHTFKIPGASWHNFNNTQVEVLGYSSCDFISNNSFDSFYFEESNLNLDFFKKFIDYIYDQRYVSRTWSHYPNMFTREPYENMLQGLTMICVQTNPQYLFSFQYPGELPISISELKFCGRVYFYSESDLKMNELIQLKEYAKEKTLHLQFRSKEFREIRSIREKPLVFISHDSRDKSEIARKLAEGLQRKNCPVWYDEFSLKVGDSLRESIEKGIKECSKCIILLTPNFINNSGWTKKEFDSIFTRELMKNEKLFLPIWAGVTGEEVYEYCPSLKVGGSN